MRKAVLAAAGVVIGAALAALLWWGAWLLGQAPCR